MTQVALDPTETVVTLLVTGDFSGSPLPLHAYFRLDASRILDLRIQG